MASAQEELLKSRLLQAQDSLAEAETLLQAGFLRGAVNRSYYAMFYAVLALTVLRQRVTSKHSGVIAFFDSEFIRPGIFPKAFSRSLHFAFDRRQENDYGAVITVSTDEANLAFQEARQFVDTIQDYVLNLQNKN